MFVLPRASVFLLGVFATWPLLGGCEPRVRERPTQSAIPSETPQPPPSAAATASAAFAAPVATLFLPENSADSRSVAAAATPSATASTRPVSSSEPRLCRVALVGDSLTARAAGGGLYVGYLEQRCPQSQFVNFAKGGAMVNQMRRKLETGVLVGAGFTHMIVFGGVNDLYSDETAGRTPAKASADLAAMYASGRAHGLRVIGITVAPWGGFTRYYNPRRAAATRELNTWILAQPAAGTLDTTVDAFSLLSCGDPERLCPRYDRTPSDGLHFGKAGHEALGAALYEAEFKSCR
jgi:lysophospholipase L1-like esterase